MTEETRLRKENIRIGELYHRATAKLKLSQAENKRLRGLLFASRCDLGEECHEKHCWCGGIMGGEEHTDACIETQETLGLTP